MLPYFPDLQRRIRERLLQAREVNAALGLGVTGPAPGAGIFAWLHRLRAGETTDRQIAIGDKRIFTQRVLAHVVGLVGGGETRERIDADA